MDASLDVAARALAAGDPLGALNRVALRDDAPALALRGIALAQLGDLPRARMLLRRAIDAFGKRPSPARARCLLAEADVAFALRDLTGLDASLDAARATFDANGDTANAVHARYIQIRCLLLTGQLDAAECALAELDCSRFPPSFQATHELMLAGIAMRRVRAGLAHQALHRAHRAATQAKHQTLIAEVEGAQRELAAPAARLVAQDGEAHMLTLDDAEALFNTRALIVDACRFAVRRQHRVISLATRPVLFTLATALAEAWPHDASRDALVAQAFRAPEADESQRARLRVEIGRLRAMLRPLVDIRATAQGFVLAFASDDTRVEIVLPPVDEAHADVLALLADGVAWSSSALALALGASQRTVQRALDTLAAAGKVEPLGRGRAQRWITRPAPGFATSLLLPDAPSALPG